MCGRYTFFTDREIREVEEILKKIDNEVNRDKLKTGEIFPSDTVPVLISEDNRMKLRLFTWGMPGFQGKRLIINARSETSHEKKMFRSALAHRRCVIPSTGFYEWDREKNKYLFNMPASHMLYMAGIYSPFEQEKRFVILTTQANTSVSKIHSRMPVVLRREELKGWLSSYDMASRLLTGNPPDLRHQMELNKAL